MGFIKAFAGAISGTFADQWKDFYVPSSNITETSAVYPAVLKSTNNGRGENYKGNANIITNGSKIVVPENTALITMQDGAITGCITEAGGYEFKSDDVNSKSMFAGDGIFGQTIKSTWEKVKFGGIPGSQQLAFYVNLKEIPNNKFGTQSEIYWDDAFLGTQVGAGGQIVQGGRLAVVQDGVAGAGAGGGCAGGAAGRRAAAAGQQAGCAGTGGCQTAGLQELTAGDGSVHHKFPLFLLLLYRDSIRVARCPLFPVSGQLGCFYEKRATENHPLLLCNSPGHQISGQD